LRGDGGRRTRKQRIGVASARFYTVSANILEWDGLEPDPPQPVAIEAALVQTHLDDDLSGWD